MNTTSHSAALAEALAPFSEIAGEMFAQNWNASEKVVTFQFQDGNFVLTAGEFFALRAAAKTHLPELLAEHAAMREALDTIARNTCCDGCQEAARVAQSALRALAASARTEGRNLDGSERRETVAEYVCKRCGMTADEARVARCPKSPCPMELVPPRRKRLQRGGRPMSSAQDTVGTREAGLAVVEELREFFDHNASFDEATISRQDFTALAALASAPASSDPVAKLIKRVQTLLEGYLGNKHVRLELQTICHELQTIAPDAISSAVASATAGLRAENERLLVQMGEFAERTGLDMQNLRTHAEAAETQERNPTPETAPARNGWRPIAEAPKDGTTILLGHWFEDDCNGYFGESRWAWQASGSIDDEGIWIDVKDDHVASEGFLAVTHFMLRALEAKP